MFKSNIRTRKSLQPQYFNVLYARIRNNCSNLNHDLFINHLRETPFCLCTSTENIEETSEHFFFRCHSFTAQRQVLFNETRKYHPLNIDILLFGQENLTVEENIDIFKSVLNLINSSKRFEN